MQKCRTPVTKPSLSPYSISSRNLGLQSSVSRFTKDEQSNLMLLSMSRSLNIQTYFAKLTRAPVTLKTNYGSETVIPLYVTGCREKIYSESDEVAKQCRLIRAIYFLPAAGDIKRYHHLRTVISLVSGFFLTLYTC